MSGAMVAAPRNIRLVSPSGVQQAVGEYVTPLGIGRQLDLVHGQELDLAVERHGLDRAHEIVGARRNDLLLAGDQGDGRPHGL